MKLARPDSNGLFGALSSVWNELNDHDPEIAALVAGEIERENKTVRLIASENHVSPAVLAAASSTLANKYANGYPGRRSYPGCENADAIETIAIDRAKRLFNAGHANVQPHSGSQANFAAYFSVCGLGASILALEPDDGGHFTHGAAGNFSQALFRFTHFRVDRDTEMIDLSAVEQLAAEVQPEMILVGGTSYPRTLDVEGFGRLSRSLGARLIVDAAHLIGLIAGGQHPDPMPHADVVTFTTHKTLRGPRGGAILCTEQLAEKVDAAVFPLTQGGPNMPSIAAKAVAFGEAMEDSFKVYAERSVRMARALAATLEANGVRIVSGGTDTHIVLADVSSLGISGAEAEQVCYEAGLAANRSRIPFDPAPSGGWSGLRLGTAAAASVGMDVAEAEVLGEAIASLLRDGSRAGERKARAIIDQIANTFSPYDRGGTAARDRSREKLDVEQS